MKELDGPLKATAESTGLEPPPAILSASQLDTFELPSTC